MNIWQNYDSCSINNHQSEKKSSHNTEFALNPTLCPLSRQNQSYEYNSTMTNTPDLPRLEKKEKIDRKKFLKRKNPFSNSFMGENTFKNHVKKEKINVYGQVDFLNSLKNHKKVAYDDNDNKNFDYQDKNSPSISSLSRNNSIRLSVVKTPQCGFLKAFFNYLVTKDYYKLAKNDLILMNFQYIDTFNDTYFIKILKNKFVIINNLIQNYINDTDAKVDFKFCNYNNYKNDILQFINNDKSYEYDNLNQDCEIIDLINFIFNLKKYFLKDEKKVDIVTDIEMFLKFAYKIYLDEFSDKNLRTKIKEFKEKNFLITVQDFLMIKAEVVNVINSDKIFFMEFFPDIYDFIEIENFFESFAEMNIKNLDFYDYCFILILFKKSKNSYKKTIYTTETSKININKNILKPFSKKSDCLLKIRFHFLRLNFSVYQKNHFFELS